MKSKVPQFLNLVESTEPDIVLGTKSWLGSDIHDSECFQSRYSVYRKDRNIHGGGVFILVRYTITSTVLSSRNRTVVNRETSLVNRTGQLRV